MTGKEILQVIIRAKDEMSGDVGRVRSAVKAFNKELTGGKRLVGDMTKKLVGLAAAYVGVRAITDFTRGLIGVNAQMEKTRVSLRVLYGDVERAADAFDYLVENASKVPFAFRDIAEAGVTIKRFGMEIEEWMEPLEDLAAFMDTDLREAASALGRAYSAGAGAADVFRERGIINVIKEFKGIEDITKMTLPEFRKAMYETFTESEKISGMTEALANTWAGKLSMMGDAWDQFRIKIGESGIFEYLKAEIDKILRRLDEMKESGELAAWAKKVSDAFVSVIETAKKLFDMAKKVYNFLADHKNEVKAVAVLMAINFAFGKLIKVIIATKNAMIAFGLATEKAAVAGARSSRIINAIKFGGYIAAVYAAIWATERLIYLYNLWQAGKKAEKETKEIFTDMASEYKKADEYLTSITRKVKGVEARPEVMREYIKEKTPEELRDVYEGIHKLAILEKQFKDDYKGLMHKISQMERESGIRLDITAVGRGGEFEETFLREVEAQGKKIAYGKYYKWLPESMVGGKPPPAAGAPGAEGGEIDFGAGGAGGGAAKLDKRLERARLLKERVLNEDVRYRLEKLNEELEYVRAAGEDTLGIEREIAREKEGIQNRWAEKYKGWFGKWSEIEDGMVEKRRAAEGIKRELTLRTVRALKGEYEYRRRLAKYELEDDKKRLGDKEILQVEYVNKIAAINKEEWESKKKKAREYSAFNLAQLERMLRDEQTAQEEKYRIQAEINRRITEDEVGLAEARNMGWRDALERFRSDAQVMIDLGRQTADSLRQGFSDTFFKTFKGEINSIGDLWRDLMTNIRDAYLRAFSDMIARRMVEKVFGGMGGGGGSSGGFAGVGATLAGGLFGGALGKIKSFAEGGVVDRPTPALLHGPEAVIPLAGGAVPVRLSGGAGGGVVQNIDIHFHTMDASSFQEYLASNGQEVIAGIAAEVAPGAVEGNIRDAGSLRKYFKRE